MFFKTIILSLVIICSSSTTFSLAQADLFQQDLPTPEVTQPLNVATPPKDTAALLKQFKASSFSTADHADLAFFIGGIHSDINVQYENAQGELKTKKFKLKLTTLGLKVALGYQIDYILFTDINAFNFYETSNTTIELGVGVRLDIPWMLQGSAMYVPFVNIKGGMIILSAGINILSLCVNLSAVLNGGTLTPCD